MGLYNANDTSDWRAYKDQIRHAVVEEGAVNIGQYAFIGCTNLTGVNIPTTVTLIEKYAFDGSGLTSVNIPATVTEIGNHTFAGCSGLKTLALPNADIKLGAGAFYNSANLTSVFIPERVTRFAEYVFGTCPQLTSAGPVGSGCAIEYGWMDRIPDYAFNQNSDLTSVIIRDGITEIGKNAFSSDGKLTTISIPNSVSVIDQAAFFATGLTSVTIPEGVTLISGAVFEGCQSLRSVSIPSSVNKIQYAAFNGCNSLEEIIIPDGVTEIEWNVFKDCTSLQSVSIPASAVFTNNDVFGGAFAGCTKLTTAGPVGSNSKIQFGWTDAIPQDAFTGSLLHTVTIPATITAIGDSAFNYDRLRNVYFEGSRVQWNVVDKGENNTKLSTAAIYYGRYDILLDNIINGSVEIAINGEAGATAVENDAVTLTATPALGYELESLIVKQGETIVQVTDNGFTMPAGDVIVTASFKALPYTISYDANGGTNAPETQTKEPAVALVLTSDIPTREAWFFLGWAENAGAASPDYLPGGSFTKDANTTLYAVWGQPDFVMPTSLTVIGDEAFSSGAFTFVKLSENTASIGADAFADCLNLRYIYIPTATTSIDPDAFGSMQNLTIFGCAGSEAEKFAADNEGVTFIALA